MSNLTCDLYTSVSDPRDRLFYDGVKYYKLTGDWPIEDGALGAPVESRVAREWLRKNGYAA